MRLATALLLSLAALYGEMIDCVAVAIDTQVVTASAIRRLIRLNAYLQRIQPDFSPESRRRAAERLVNQTLIQKEMTLIRYPLPNVPEALKEIQEIQESRKQNDAAFHAELARYGFTVDDLQQEIIWQLTLTRFIDFRFRPAVQVSEEEITKYYEEELKPKQTEPADLDDVRAGIVRVLTARKLNDALSQWLEQQRAATRITYFPVAFQ